MAGHLSWSGDAMRIPAERRVGYLIGAEVDTRPAMRVADLAAKQWGVVSLADLRACGFSRRAVAMRVRQGRLHPVHRGVYAVGHSKLPLEGSFLAAVKACGAGALLSHFSAASLWGLVGRDDRHPEVTVRGGATRVHSGVCVHRTRTLAAEDRARLRGISITAPARTLGDLSCKLEYRRLRRAVRQAEALRLVQPGELVQAISRLGPRRGVRGLARIVSTGPAPTRSELEDVVLDLILRAGFERPDINVSLMVGGRRVIPDFRWPKQRLVVEAHGAAWHENRLAREDDAERQALLEAHGERVIRVTWEQAIARPAEVLKRFRAS